jgi:23S rRNA (adenine2503-C2)-methyltransferase
VSRYDLDEAALAAHLAPLPRYRARQLFEGMHERLAEPGELTELPRALRESLAADPVLAPALRRVAERSSDGGGTTKWLFELFDGSRVETVLMHHPRHSTVCISSQAGCAMACAFCATGDAGFARQLSVGEIVEQVVRAARASACHGRRLDHVVFMGMGEPLANLGAVWPAVERIVGPLGLAARHVTISTVGIVPGIRRLASSPRQVNLAVSLHAADDDKRDRLVPINRRYPLRQLLAACEEYVGATHRRLSFEWALMDGVNDTPEDAAGLAGLALRLGAHVNVIPLNPTVAGARAGLAGSRPERVRAFRENLVARGVNVTVRRPRGREIDAACGQLAARGAAPSGHRPASTLRRQVVRGPRHSMGTTRPASPGGARVSGG